MASIAALKQEESDREAWVNKYWENRKGCDAKKQKCKTDLEFSPRNHAACAKKADELCTKTKKKKTKKTKKTQKGSFVQTPSPSPIPTFTASFDGKPEITMVGGDPKDGGTTNIPTSILIFDLTYGNISIPGPSYANIVNSALWQDYSFFTDARKAQYPATQYGNAIHRVQFSEVMQNDWNTLLGQPRKLTATGRVTLDLTTVPGYNSTANMYARCKPSSTCRLSVYNTSWLLPTLLAKLKDSGPSTDELAIMVFGEVDWSDKCITSLSGTGWHNWYPSDPKDLAQPPQTYVASSYLSTARAKELFGDYTLADMASLSQDITNWFSNPYLNNTVPCWQAPGYPWYSWSDDILAPADPVDDWQISGFTLTTKNFTHHLESVLVRQWFQRLPAPSILKGVYNFPPNDESIVLGDVTNITRWSKGGWCL